MKCLVLADQLGNELLMSWALLELNGFPAPQELPDYRILHSHSEADVTNGVRYERLVVPTDAFPEQLRDAASVARIAQGVGSLQSLNRRETLRLSWPDSLKRYFEENLLASEYEPNSYRVRDAWVVVSLGMIDGVLSAIRGRVLQFVFQVRKDHPEYDESPTSSNAPTNSQVNHYTNLILMGTGSTASFGTGSLFVSNIEQQIVAGDLASLKAFLGSQGVGEHDLDALEKVVADTAPEDLGDEQSAIRRWIDRAGDTVSAGGKDLVKTAARELILLSVRYYFGQSTA